MKNFVVTALSALALAGTNSANAGTLVATSTGFFGSFSIDFQDDNANGLLEITEIDAFSGFFTNSFIGTMITVIGIPDIPDVSTAALLPGVTNPFGNSYWLFERAGEVDNSADLFAGSDSWTYEIIDEPHAVPLPGSIPLVTIALAGLGLAARRRKAP